ncbi:MAG TPA: hypothetical protein VGO60_05315 [Iamia sp.]|jgi:hypothetical protein|nr:hypothetical protein [Iamia sp.]
MPTDLDPIAVLARTDPAAGRPVPVAPTFDELVALPALRSARHRGRAVVLAAAVLLVVLVAGVAIAVATDTERDPSPPADTAPATESDATLPRLELTVREPAAPALLALADRAEADLAVVPAASVAYARTVSRNQEITVDGDRTSIDHTASQQETWTEPDGRYHWRRGPGPTARDGSVVQVGPDLLLPGGDLVDGDPTVAEPLARPQGVDAVRADLHVGQGGQPEPYNALERLVEILGRQPLLADDRAALYRALATIDGIEHRGEVVDRAGRDGIAFSYETDFAGALSELIVVVNDETGELLETEEVMLESAPAIPIDEPVVQRYEVVLTVASVAAVGERP